MMYEQQFQLDVLSPLILSQSSSTGAEHVSLDYIPGSALLGIAASQLYQTLSKDECWTLFNSGQVQFSNGYIASADSKGRISQCLPVPLAFNTIKGQKKLSESGHYNSLALRNTIHPDFVHAANEPLKPERTGYLSATGKLLNVGLLNVVKTAISRSSGTVAKGKLFNYQAIDVNQTFIFTVKAPDISLLDTIAQALKGIRYIGRSRSAEFGKVNISVLAEPATLVNITPTSDEVVVWCTSDICLPAIGNPASTKSGQPLYWFHGYAYQPQISTVRFDTIRLYNRARGGFDREYATVKQGSVLVFKRTTGNQDTLTSTAQKGIGANLAQGFGQVLINPPWMNSLNELPEKAFDIASAVKQKTIYYPSQPKQTGVALNAWLSEKLNVAQQQTQRYQVVQQSLNKLVNLYLSARRLNRTVNANSAGPGRIQWRVLLDRCRHQNNALSAPDFAQVCKTSNDPIGWGIETSINKTFANEAQAIFLAENMDYESQFELLEIICRSDMSAYRDLIKLRNSADSAVTGGSRVV